MSKILDKINEMLIQKFPDAVRVEIHKSETGMQAHVTYESGRKVDGVKTLNGSIIETNIIKEEE